ncbi:MAG: hypothetical protein JSR82_21395 [Verrucomicrobia bacterium]|nr:hypothetical protein [Verrucomicrobiota bacterium]
MKRTDENYVVMFQTVAELCAKHRAVWSATPAVVESLRLLEAEIALMREASVTQTRPTKGITEAKSDVRGDLEDAVLELSDALGALAAERDDRILEAAADVTPSSLGRLSGEALDREVTSLVKLARERLSELAPHGVSEAEVKEVEDAQKAFAAIKTQPRQAIVGRAAQTAALPERVSAMKEFLRERLDRQMRRFRRSQPEFYAEYRGARVVLGENGGGKEEKATDEKVEVTPPAA